MSPNKTPFWTKRTIPRLTTLLLSLTALLLLAGVAAVLRAAYKNTYYVSFGAPAWAGLFMIGPSFSILHSTAVLVIHAVGRATLKAGVDMVFDFFGMAANVASAAFLVIQAMFAGEMLRSCDEPGDFEGREWCREARRILGLEATAAGLVLVVGLMHLVLCLDTCSGVCNRHVPTGCARAPIHGKVYEVDDYPDGDAGCKTSAG